MMKNFFYNRMEYVYTSAFRKIPSICPPSMVAPHPATVALPAKVCPERGSLVMFDLSDQIFSNIFRDKSFQLQNDYKTKNELQTQSSNAHIYLVVPTSELIVNEDSSSIRQMSPSILVSSQSG